MNERRLAARIERGEVVRIAPGSFVLRDSWASVGALGRHAQRVWEAAARTEPGTVFAFHAAAAMHGIDILGDWPGTVDIWVARTSGGRSTGQLRRHTTDMSRLQIIPWGRHFITSVAQTVLDLAAARPFVEGVVAADQALWARRHGGPLLTPDELRAALAVFEGRGAARARRVVQFASPESDSVRETHSRVLIAQLGFPAPVLQREFRLPSGRRARPDFFWVDSDHGGEFDGVGKYIDPDILRGRTPEQALMEQKDREDELRRVIGSLSRWRTPDLTRPARLYDILTRAGLPTNRPRPGY